MIYLFHEFDNPLFGFAVEHQCSMTYAHIICLFNMVMSYIFHWTIIVLPNLFHHSIISTHPSDCFQSHLFNSLDIWTYCICFYFTLFALISYHIIILCTCHHITLIGIRYSSILHHLTLTIYNSLVISLNHMYCTQKLILSSITALFQLFVCYVSISIHLYHLMRIYSNKH
jgi:hypothetical protein